MADQTPTPQQQAVIDAVCGLANALMRWGRGAGQTWTRQRIAERILADDGVNAPPNLSGHLSGTYLEGDDHA